MKKSLRLFSSSLLLGMMCLLMLTVNAFAQTVLAVNEVRVVSTSGLVAAKSADGKSVTISLKNVSTSETPIVAKQGPRSTLATGAASEAFIAIPSTGTFRMGADTQVRLPPEDEKGHSLELLKGKLFLNINSEELKKRGNATFRLKTPTALLAVKGTRFFAFSVSATDLAGVNQGSVEVLEPTSNQTMVLNSGSAVTVSMGVLGKERRLTQEESLFEKFYALAAPKGGFTNSLGMKFVPVPETKVLFCIHETRYKDYESYAAEAQGVDATWKNQTLDGFTLTDWPADHPVLNVSWEDAQKFCTWLGQKEGRRYRLPTDHEWSYAVGIEKDEHWEKDSTPSYIQRRFFTYNKKEKYPWGHEWPPPNGIGNYSDLSRKAKTNNTKDDYIKGYDDGFPTTAPVMSFRPNEFGLYDLGGNVSEFCDDWYDKTNALHVLRGESWKGYNQLLKSNNRSTEKPNQRDSSNGFRCVVVADDG